MSDEYLILEIFPQNLRHIHITAEMIIFFASMVANCALFAILATERSREMRHYARILLINCAFDVVYTVASGLTVTEYEVVEERGIAVLNGPLAASSVFVQYAAFFVWMFALSASLAIIPLVFVFRYVLIVRKRHMTRGEVSVYVGVALAFGLHQAVAWTVAFSLHGENDRIFTCKRLINYTVWTRESIESCLITAENSKLALYAMSACTVVNSLMYVTMTYSTLTVLATLRKTENSISTKTATLQRQMNRMLIVQMYLPVISAVIPLLASVSFPIFLRLYIPGIGIFASMALSFIPLMSPLVTILFVHNFRRKLLYGMCRWCLPYLCVRHNTVADAHTAVDTSKVPRDVTRTQNASNASYCAPAKPATFF